MRTSSLLIVFLMSSLCVLSAHALEIRREAPISNAISFYLSPNGQNLILGQGLEHALWNYGLSLREGSFDNVHNSAREEFDLNNLPDKYSKFQPMIKTFRENMQRWFTGKPFKNPKVSVFIKNAEYKMSFKKIGMIPDPNLLRAKNLSGAIFMLDIVVNRLSVDLDEVIIRDENNYEQLGDIGALKYQTALIPQSPALHVQIPFHVSINDQKHVVVKALEINSNVGDIIFDPSYMPKLVLPEVGGWTRPRYIKNGLITEAPKRNERILKETEVETEVRKHQGQIVQFAQNFIEDFIHETLPSKVNEVLQGLTGTLTEINQINPPGRPEGDAQGQFVWGLYLQDLESTGEYLRVALGGHVEDPNKPTTFINSHPATNVPTLIPGDKYHYAFSINQDFVNRMLQLSFNRKYFSHVKIGDGKKSKLPECQTEKAKSENEECRDQEIQMTETPKVILDQESSCEFSKFSKVRLRITGAIDGVHGMANSGGVGGFIKKVGATLAVKDEINMTVDIIARLEDTGFGIDLILDSIDTKSLKINDGPRIGKTKGMIEGFARGALDGASKGFKTKTVTVAHRLPIPPNLTGIPAKLHTICADKGYLVMYLNKINLGLVR